MANKKTIKIPEWQHKAIKKIQEKHEHGQKSIPETIERLLTMFTGQTLATLYDFKFSLYAEEMEDKELERILTHYWASLSRKEEETILEFWEKVDWEKARENPEEIINKLSFIPKDD